MREAAAAYCEVIETAADTPRVAFVESIARTMSVVVASAYQLPSLDLDDSAEDAPMIDTAPITHEQWLIQYGAVRNTLREWDNYWTTFRAYDLDETTRRPNLSLPHDHAVNISLADALTDIWRDLRDGLNNLAIGVPKYEVVWEWRFTFIYHWGLHATDALRAIHAQLVESNH